MKPQSNPSWKRPVIEMHPPYHLSMRFRLGQVSILGTMLLVVGCGSRAPMGESIHGQVTVNGVPLGEGLITFVPKDATTGNKVSTTIQSGAYQLVPEDGLNAGSFRVEIMGLPPGIKAMAEGKHPSMEKRAIEKETYREIDEKYNEKSSLECIATFGVVNVADFQVRYAK